MHVLTKGRDGLKRQGIAAAGDLTTRQQISSSSIVTTASELTGGRLRPRPQNGRNHADAEGEGRLGTQASQSPPFPSYSKVTQMSAVDRYATDVSSTSTSQHHGFCVMCGHPQSGPISGGKKRDTTLNSYGGGQSPDGQSTCSSITCSNLKVCAWNCEGGCRTGLERCGMFLTFFPFFYACRKHSWILHNCMTHFVFMMFLSLNLQNSFQGRKPGGVLVFVRKHLSAFVGHIKSYTKMLLHLKFVRLHWDDIKMPF